VLNIEIPSSRPIT
jgi:hypothetical protein